MYPTPINSTQSNKEEEEEYELIDEHNPSIILSEYWHSPDKCVKMIIKDLPPEHQTGRVLIELASDKFDLVKDMLEKLGMGQKLGRFLRKGSISFEQARSLARLERIKDPDVVYDEKGMCVRMEGKMGLSSIVSYALIVWGHRRIEDYVNGGKNGEMDEKQVKMKKEKKILKERKKLFPKRKDFFETNRITGYDLFITNFFPVIGVTVVSLGRLCVFFSDKQSKKQLFKDIAKDIGGTTTMLAGGVAGAKYGAVLGTSFWPGMGTTFGGIIGGVVGMAVGKVTGKKITKTTIGFIIKDDHDRMVLILSKSIQILSIKYILTESETREFCEVIAKMFHNQDKKQIQNRSKLFDEETDITEQHFSVMMGSIHKIEKSKRLDACFKIVEPYLINFLKEKRKCVTMPSEVKKVIKEKDLLHHLTTSVIFDVPAEEDIIQVQEKTSQKMEKYSDAMDEYFCPITGDIMINPVIASDGHTYERSAIEKWIVECKKKGTDIKSPLSGIQMERKLIPNHTLKKLILAYLAKKEEEK